MTNFIIDAQRRLLAGFVALVSTLFISMTRLESNPQNCEMINSQTKKDKEYSPTENYSL